MFVQNREGLKYRIKELLSKGDYGKVFSCHLADVPEQLFAIKLIQDQSLEQTNREIHIMKTLSGNQGFPTLIDYGQGTNGHQVIPQPKGPNYEFIVQEKLGKSFKDVLNQEGKMNSEQVLNLALSLINSIEKLHSIGYIHQDIKPDNLMFPIDNRETPYIIDFGRAAKFYFIGNLSQIQYHRQNIKKTFVGNEWFSSKNIQFGERPSRRDDIISLLYTLVYMATGYQKMLQQHNQQNFIMMSSAQEFCEGAEYLTPLLEEAYSYKYALTPNYEKLRQIVTKQLNQNNAVQLNVFIQIADKDNESDQYSDVDEEIMEYPSEKIHFLSDNNRCNLNSDKFSQASHSLDHF